MSSPWDTAGRVRRNLVVIRNVWAATITAISQPDNDPVTSSNSPTLIPADVLDARRECHKDLRFFAMLTLEQVNGGTISEKVNALDVEALTWFLDKWALHLSEQLPDDAEQAASDFEKHGRKLRGFVRGDRIHRYHVGRCPEVDTDDERLVACAGTLIATMHQGDAMLPKAIACDANGQHVWQPYQWHSLGKRLEEVS